MLAHFNKLQTPLQSVDLYPTVNSQETRFKNRGWPDVKARNLWGLWNSRDFLTPEQRISLDEIEPFDEWEEFALFGEHYFLLLASTNTDYRASLKDNLSTPLIDAASSDRELLSRSTKQQIPMQIYYKEYPNGEGCRRFGENLILRHTKPSGAVANFAGMGLNTRLNSFDVYSTETKNPFPAYPASSNSPSPRMCHSIADLGDTALITGGRTSPDNALSDCWIYHKKTQSFEQVQDLTMGRYRHSTVAIGNGTVLLMGGKSDSRTIEQNCLVWRRDGGWQKISQCPSTGMADESMNSELPALYGATSLGPWSGTRGLLFGGLTKDGTLSSDLWSWTYKADVSVVIIADFMHALHFEFRSFQNLLCIEVFLRYYIGLLKYSAVV